jgi:hypothetical protein
VLAVNWRHQSMNPAARSQPKVLLVESWKWRANPLAA